MRNKDHWKFLRNQLIASFPKISRVSFSPGTLTSEVAMGNYWETKEISQKTNSVSGQLSFPRKFSLSVLLGKFTFLAAFCMETEDLRKMIHSIDQDITHSSQGETDDVVKLDESFQRIKICECEQFEGCRVKVFGWIHQKREASKKLWFIVIRDGTGFLQCVLSGKLVNLKDAQLLSKEASVCLWGTLKKPLSGKFTPNGYELSLEYYEVIGSCSTPIESIDSSVDTKLDQRHLVLRGEHASGFMKIRSHIMWCFRQHFFSRGYHEVTPPTIVQAQAEGGSELFPVNYFNQKAYLTQSSQLYLETVLSSFGSVFCIAQSYRAEHAKTRRHLAEFTHLEAEIPFITFEELLSAVEDLICDSIQRLMDMSSELLLKINPKARVPKRPFKRMDYVDALEFLKKNEIYKDPELKIPFQFGDDIPEAPERQMVELIGEPVFLCRFPVELKAFYMQPCAQDPRITESADLLVPGVGEIVGASQRIWNYDELMLAYKRVGIDPSIYYWYTDQRRFGSVPHGGYGIGVERFITWVLGDDHIRNACLYPRRIDRCQP